MTVMGEVVDLTRPLDPGTRVYPGDPPVAAETYATHEKDGYYARRVCMPEHAGTHVDAPIHFYPGGIDASSIPAWRLIAPALVIGSLRGIVTADELRRAIGACSFSSLRGWILLVKGEPVLGWDAAELLVSMGAAGLGVETMSPDENPYPVHRVLLPRGALIIENLDLARLEPCTRLTLFIGVLRLIGGSGAPARIIGLLDNGLLGLSVFEHYVGGNRENGGGYRDRE